ncbi:Tyrosine/DOPA decarboxylase 5 [Dichanthelium oligosanthes]|uniref:Tyrosine/DOPA decarboxylase 5 n=1 Tax=Dichanthelium oligosanthes TaxID=888268 RepID=A0A1E5W5Q4_9POAL|nr:Tyrosine/DOPA decarboxylase 5 [Dichanthelium oligosanthes]
MPSLVQPPLDADEFRRQGRLVVDFIADYYARIDEYTVRPAVVPGLNINPFTWAASPAATELEVIRHRHQLARQGAASPGEVVVTHFSFQKAARIAGIRRGNYREIPTTRESGFTLSPKALHAVRAYEAAGRVPLFLCATVGTTPTAAVDPLRELCAAVSGHDVWVHVDAAYAGAACVCPEFRHAIAGAEAVDSFSTNPHKWLLANMDCCALWARRPEALTAALGTDHGVILKDPSA